MSATPPLEPEIAYFRDIERAFVLRRGHPLFISNADWVFLAKLRKKGVPMRVVLRGMTDAFDAHAHSFARKQKVLSLKFCEAEITAAGSRYRRALQADGPSRRGLRGAIEKLEAQLGAIPTAPILDAAVAEARQALVETATSVDRDPDFDPNQALLEAEDILVLAVQRSLGPVHLAEVDRKTRDATAAYKSRMPAAVYETLIGESVRRKTLQHFGLPRLLLEDIE